EEENPMNLAEKDQKIDSLFTDYYEKLINRLKEFKDSSIADSEINKLRTEMSEQCDEFAKKSSNIYTLSIPTGGGKTLASRSEVHTSELQSRFELVCRLLLEKKKYTNSRISHIL